MARVLCCICKEDYELENIRVSLCGHGYCIPCDSQTKTCPICRRPKLHEHSIRLYLTFLDDLTLEERARNVIDKLSEVNVDTSAKDVEVIAEASCAIVKEGHSLFSGSPAAAESLTHAVRSLGERIQPMYIELEHLKEERDKLSDQLKHVETRENMIGNFQSKLQELKRERRETRALCQALRDELGSSKASNVRLARRVDRMRREIEEVRAECQRLEEQTTKQYQETSLLKKKLRVIAKETRRPRQDIEDTLLVEPPTITQHDRGENLNLTNSFIIQAS